MIQSLFPTATRCCYSHRRECRQGLESIAYTAQNFGDLPLDIACDHNRNACPLWQTSTYIQGLSAEIHIPTGYSWRIFVPTPLRQRSGQLYTRSPHTQLIAHCLGRPFSQKFNPTRKNVQYCLSKLKWLPIFFVSSVTPWPLFRFSIYFTSQNFVMTFQDSRIEKEIVLKLYFFKA